MCRIVGFVDFNLNKTSESVLVSMRDVLTSGGPDGYGLYVDGNIGFAHRRLSIIDLSTAGSQPMKIGKWIITYNGEIYNYQEIKNSLLKKGIEFISNTDTEVIIRSIDTFGFEALKLFRGMFAFSLFDSEKSKMYLCRDRLGVKPLYYYLKDDLFLFSSEIKAFHQHPSFDKSINKEALPHFFQKGYINPVESIFTYVKPVTPGTILEIDTEKNDIKYREFWNVRGVYMNAKIDERSEDEITNDLEGILLDSFDLRMVSDVDVGIFLSGGIDSSLIASVLQSNSTKKIQTFTIGFEDKKYDESGLAEEISKHLGTKHSKLMCTNEQLESTLDLLPEIFDEPFGDSSAIPTYLVSKLASGQVKVALSGDGGDELFGGYSKYKFAKHADNILKIPFVFRKILHNSSPFLLSPYLQNLSNKLFKEKYIQIESKSFKFKQILLSKNLNDFIYNSSSYLSLKNTELLSNQKITQDNGIDATIKEGDLISYFGLSDMLSYLPGDILVKVDRTSMAVGLESREPFLDPKLIEFAFTIPGNLKITKDGSNKYLLRRILKKYLPDDLIDKHKKGFSVPMDEWLSNQLKNDILEIGKDDLFFNHLNLNQEYFNEIILSFYSGDKIFDPHFIWFTYCLHKWYKKWI